jgi:CO/xanthine dehydrogenase FAD-binding subunit
VGDFKPDYIVASSPTEVVSLLQEHHDKARIIAGGTLLHELGFRGLLGNVQTLIDITKLGLGYTRWENGGLRIGATTTFTELLEALQAKKDDGFAVLEDALRSIRPVQVRNVATVGGSICTSVPFFDLPVALLAMDASVRVMGPVREREQRIGDFSQGYFATDLKPGEFVTEIQIPSMPADTSGAFLKLETNSVDWALVSTAVRLRKEHNIMRNTRVVLGGSGVDQKARRVASAERALEGKGPSVEVIGSAADAIANDVKFTSDFRASAEYRAEVAKVFVRRCLHAALSRIGGS